MVIRGVRVTHLLGSVLRECMMATGMQIGSVGGGGFVVTGYFCVV